MIVVIFGIYAFVFLIMILTIKTKYHVYTKTLMSLTFLAIAIYGGMISNHMTQLYALIPGLIGCVIGDFLLATHYKKSFLYGLSAFLIANTFYVIYFFHYMSFTIIEFIIPVSSLITLICFSFLPKMNYGDSYKPICVYSFMIAWAMSKSIMTYMLLPTTTFFFAMLGFILYYISDFILLFDRFYDNDFKILRIMNLSTYYLGMLLIAYSIF